MKENIIYCPNKLCGKVVYRQANSFPRDENGVIGEVQCPHCKALVEIIIGYFARLKNVVNS